MIATDGIIVIIMLFSKKKEKKPVNVSQFPMFSPDRCRMNIQEVKQHNL